MLSIPILPILFTLMLDGTSPAALTADERAQIGSPSAPGESSERPQQPGLMPPLPPPEIDPGIQRYPETTPHPESVVPPPQVDPDMAINPETREPLKDSPVPKPDPHPGPSDPVPLPPPPAPPMTPRQ
jgi:hypothetical protein